MRAVLLGFMLLLSSCNDGAKAPTKDQVAELEKARSCINAIIRSTEGLTVWDLCVRDPLDEHCDPCGEFVLRYNQIHKAKKDCKGGL